MHSRNGKRLRILVVLGSVGGALVMTSACTGVVGLTGYDFVDGSDEGSTKADGASADGAGPNPGDGAVATDAAGAICRAAFADFPSACATCAESKCCVEAVACARVTGCATRARANTCSGGADVACRAVTNCLKDKCSCN